MSFEPGVVQRIAAQPSKLSHPARNRRNTETLERFNMFIFNGLKTAAEQQTVGTFSLKARSIFPPNCKLIQSRGAIIHYPHNFSHKVVLKRLKIEIILPLLKKENVMSNRPAILDLGSSSARLLTFVDDLMRKLIE